MTEPLRETPRGVRIQLGIPAMVTDSDGGSLEVIVRDLSSDGCRLETDGSLIGGEKVRLHAGKGPPTEAVVAWVQGFEAGLRF